MHPHACGKTRIYHPELYFLTQHFSPRPTPSTTYHQGLVPLYELEVWKQDE